jgi:MFS family permease
MKTSQSALAEWRSFWPLPVAAAFGYSTAVLHAYSIGPFIGALALGAAFGPLAAGAAFDRYGSYRQFLVLTMVFMAASSLAMATLSRPRFGVRHG